MELKVEIPSYAVIFIHFLKIALNVLQFCLTNIVANFAFVAIVHKFTIQFFGGVAFRGNSFMILTQRIQVILVPS